MKNERKNVILEIVEFLDYNEYITSPEYTKYTGKLEELQNNIDMIVSLLESPHKERFKHLTTWRSENESQS